MHHIKFISVFTLNLWNWNRCNITQIKYINLKCKPTFSEKESDAHPLVQNRSFKTTCFGRNFKADCILCCESNLIMQCNKLSKYLLKKRTILANICESYAF